jgi:hypothetical protein
MSSAHVCYDCSAASKVLSQKHILDGREVDVKRAVPRDRTSPSGASAPITKTGVTVTNTSGSGGAGSVRSPSSSTSPLSSSSLQGSSSPLSSEAGRDTSVKKGWNRPLTSPRQAVGTGPVQQAASSTGHVLDPSVTSTAKLSTISSNNGKNSPALLESSVSTSTPALSSSSSSSGVMKGSNNTSSVADKSSSENAPKDTEPSSLQQWGTGNDQSIDNAEQLSESGSNKNVSAVASAVSPNSASGKSEQARKVFVGGLAPSVTDAEFRAYFEKFGAIADAVVMFDRQVCAFFFLSF